MSDQLQQSLIAARLRIRELEARVLELQEQIGRATDDEATERKRARELARETKRKRKT